MLRRGTSSWLLYILIAVAFCGCVPVPKRFTKPDILGTYEIHYPFGTETLELRADDTYQQRFTDTSGKTFAITGRWTFDTAARSNQVALIDAMELGDGFGKFGSTVPKRGLHMRSLAWYGGTVISLNEDLGMRMRKIK
jgi:hypothetical protein